MAKKEISNIKSIQNNVFALKIGWDLSKSRVVHTGMFSAVGYFEWLFYSTFFMRYVVNAIDHDKSFHEVFLFILLCCAIFVSISLYTSYVGNVVIPLTNTRIYQGLYSRLYQKARNVELRCFEDTDFYNKYTMAIDGAGDKITAVINNLFSVIFGVVSAVVAFYTMYQIDHIAIFFVISPICGNFIFGGIMNKIYTQRYLDNVPFERKKQYVNRVMQLADYAKEVRLSNVYRLMMRKYEEAVQGSINVAQKHAKRSILMSWLQNFLTFPIVFEGIMIYAAYRTMVSNSMSLAELGAGKTTILKLLFRLYDPVSGEILRVL